MKRAITETIARSDRAVVGGAVGLLIVLSWIYTIRASTSMQYMGVRYAFPMWIVMMIAMMTPSVTPVLLVFSYAQHRNGERQVAWPVGAFLVGYLALWCVFSMVAAGIQAALSQAGLISAMGVSTNRFLTAGVLIAAGLYQFSPWKDACLLKCRTPLGFLLTEWRDGMGGAVIMGLRHGLNCIGCCWLLMGLMFAVGTMNLVWTAALTIVVVAEKTLPGGGTAVRKLIGMAAFLSGLWLLGVTLSFVGVPQGIIRRRMEVPRHGEVLRLAGVFGRTEYRPRLR